MEVADSSAVYTWLLGPNEKVEDVIYENNFDFKYTSDMLAKGPEGVNPIFYVKWQNLSYVDCTWEHASTVRTQDETDSKIKDFERFNRSLDNNSRQKMMGFSYAHK